MILAKYIAKRFFIYFFIVNIGLTLLFNFIEFFEKFSQLQNIKTIEIAHFIFLNLIPSFFDLIPLASWLGVCLLIRELYQKNEITNFYVLGIKPRKLMPTFLFCGLTLVLISFIGKELISRPLSQVSETFKAIHLKKNTNKIIYNQWFLPQEDLFVYFQVLDFEKSIAQNAFFLFLNHKFELEKKLESSKVILSPIDQKVFIPNGNSFNFKTNTISPIAMESLYLPGLFAHLKMHKGIPSLKRQILNLQLIRKILPYETYNLELGLLWSRVLSFLQPLLFIFLTFCLFFGFLRSKLYKWILIFATYPIILVLNSIAQFSLQHNAPFFVILIPYLIALITCLICSFTVLEK